MRIIDFHVHAFPDAIAERAVPQLAQESNIPPYLDGKITSVLRSMDAAGIAKSVICSIATRPDQFHGILKWSRSIASDRLVPFPSVHPDDPELGEHIRQIAGAGFKGIKLHSYYQDFDMDEPKAYRIYDEVQQQGLILLCHTRFDTAYPRVRKADPLKCLRVVRDFPQLKLVTTHLGAWDDWEEVRRHLLGKPIYTDISFSLNCMSPQEAKNLLLAHPVEYLIFATDSPWDDQRGAIDALCTLRLGEKREEAIFYSNAARLLGCD